MSSPMHSLKKNKVPLFPGHMSGHRPIPFRHPDYSEDESRLLEEVTSLMVQDRRKKDPFVGLPQINAANQTNLATGVRNNDSPRENGNVEGISDPPTDQDLMRMMINKIAFLEQQVTTQNEDLRVKERRIKVLEDKLKIVGKANGQGEGGRVKATVELEKHCLLLQQQVHEMETFLAEYGMVWVGEENNDEEDDDNAGVYISARVDDDDDEDDDDNNDIENNNNMPDNLTTGTRKRRGRQAMNPLGIWSQDDSFVAGGDKVPSTAAGMNVDFDVLVENIKDLNVLAGEGVAQIKKTADGARFEIPDSVQLTLYANGILMFNGPFRPYSDPSTRQCVQDLLDGYFPSELQNRFPDGVPFQLTDLRGVTYQTRQPPKVFTGEGQTLGGEKKPSRLIQSKYQDPVNWSDSDPKSTAGTSTGRSLTQSQFLNKLPKSVIRDGKVIDVRDSITNTLTGKTNDRPKSNITLVNTAVTKEMSECLANANANVAAQTQNANNAINKGKGTKNTLGNANEKVNNAAVAGASMIGAIGENGPRPKSYTGHKDVTTLRVVTENGDHTYIVKMKFKETIGNLRSYLDLQRRPKAPYDIVSTFPHKVHKNNTVTLEDAGLTPNAVLHLKSVT